MIIQSTFFRTLLALGVAVLVSTGANAAENEKPQYYELRVYTTKSEAQQQRILDASLDRTRLEKMPVNKYVDHYVA